MSWLWIVAILVAVVVSMLHGIPGWIYALYSFSGVLASAPDNKWKDVVEKHPTFWKWVYCLHHALIYVVSSLVGFGSLFLVVLILNNKVLVTAELTAGKAAVLIALLFFTVAGVSGVLGKILWKTNRLPRGLGG